jgi:tellurite resistance protein TerC
MDPAILTILVQLTFIECILSIDNAAVMGAMVAHLPDDQLTPWPEWIGGSLGWADRLLGSQRDAALKVGLFGAYAGRVLMLALASIIVELSWVQILGALYLIYLGVSHFIELFRKDDGPEDGAQDTRLARQRGKGFWSVVLALNLADMAFSLDNVVAAVALSNLFWVVALGVGIGIVIIRFGATLFTRLMVWEPALEHAAYLLLLAIGGELILEQWLHIEIGDLLKFAISMSILALTVVVARVRAQLAARRDVRMEHDVN